MEIKQLVPMDKVLTFFGEFKSATVESTIKGIVKHSRRGHLQREDYVNGGHCRPWCQGAQGLSEHHFHDSPGLRSLLRYTPGDGRYGCRSLPHNEILFNIIKSKTKVTQEQLDEVLQKKKDRFLTAEEALGLGVLTELM